MLRRTAVLISCCLLLLTAASTQAAQAPRPIISVGQDGRLVYEVDERGDRVPDFSHCGYGGGLAVLPDANTIVVVEAKPGDSTERIQRAIDYVAASTADVIGIRGVVLLAKGRHEVFGSLRITNSGVILRGQGMGDNGTVLVAAGLDRRTLIQIAGRRDMKVQTNADWQIADAYVPVGATSFRLKHAAGLKAGQTVRVIRPSTQDWIDRLNAAEFGGGIGGGWKPGSRDLIWDRSVKSVEGNVVTVDAPITTALESEYGGGRFESYDWPGRVRNVAVENLRLESAYDSANPKDENHSWCAITMENATDSWVRQVTFKHFAGSAVAVYETCKRVTVADCLSLAPVSEDGGYRRHTFFTMGQQVLFLRCYAEKGRHDFSVGHAAAGPNAFVQCEAHLAMNDSGSIESWASGVLFDNVVIDGNALTLGFRAGSGNGVGWAAANSVLWQCSASVIRCWNPPTARNWSFGSWAIFEGDGIWRSSNDFVSPDSLYAGQLKDRLGAKAADALNLMPRPREESSNPPVDKAQELAAASHGPAPLLADYIAAASSRDPIPCEPSEVKRIEEIGAPISESARTGAKEKRAESEFGAPKKPLLLTNGWLTCDGRILVGGTASVSWWRGNIRPDEAKTFGLGVTRFVPGRIGPGFTDDLIQVADSLVAGGDVALDHNYGLWYDRRRDDHERVRRINGDVLPPFYEQPFARSGKGTAWDGLSQYDLARFNPWYWSRLRGFAGVCDERGLVLFHQNYFQHNILEAGAHWADSPWRSANNLNGTGFPEPPPYAGDKRIFQAELFYDVKHPVRRELHRNYIRQCLDSFTNNANVIQFTSAEFTGPLNFMEYWLDTIAEWEQQRVASGILPDVEPGFQPGAKAVDGRNASDKPVTSGGIGADPGGRMPPSTAGRMPAATKSLIALSCTKDVQDAILADTRRAAVVDVIDFRYWWRTDRGEFAPPGGKNLAPRQFERQWRGGRPNDVNLARMASEYRKRFPGKAIICDFDTAGWAWVCAGGSLPRLPGTTDPKLLTAILKMQPWSEVSGTNQWVLGERGRQLLVYSTGATELDLSGESGMFRVATVNAKTGQVTSGETVKAGQQVKLPKSEVIWLVKE